jgi:autotransporter-associated beta strand protein
MLVVIVVGGFGYWRGLLGFIAAGHVIRGVTDKITQTDNAATISAKVGVDADGIEISAAGTLTISGEISGAGTITKTGTGTLELKGANTFTGALAISAGTVKLGNAAGLGTADGGTSVASGATLDLGGYSVATAEALGLIGTGVGGNGALINSGAAATYAGVVTIGAGGATIGAGDITLNAALAPGANALTKTGAGTLALTTNSTRSGTTTINGDKGTVRVHASAALGTGATTINSSGTLQINTCAAAFSSVINLNNGGTLVGTTAHVYGNLVLDNKDAASSAKAVNVYDGAMLDLAASGAGIAKVNMQPGGVEGGAIANTGGSLSAADVATLFPSYYSYILGSALTGNTKILDGALLDNAFGKNLWKVGANQVTLEDMAGEGEDVSHYGFFRLMHSGFGLSGNEAFQASARLLRRATTSG